MLPMWQMLSDALTKIVKPQCLAPSVGAVKMA